MALHGLLKEVPSGFTFHSGYILIGMADKMVMLEGLYIPFWLYSNEVGKTYIECDCSFTFHSGYILMAKELCMIQRTENLYIPFWLYSNLSQRVLAPCSFELYIPFWLYSNPSPIIPPIYAI